MTDAPRLVIGPAVPVTTQSSTRCLALSMHVGPPRAFSYKSAIQQLDEYVASQRDYLKMRYGTNGAPELAVEKDTWMRLRDELRWLYHGPTVVIDDETFLWRGVRLVPVP